MSCSPRSPTPTTHRTFFNEIALDADGNAYVSDTLAPTIWRAEADLSGLAVFAEDPLLNNPAEDQPFSLNGLALTPDGAYLIASVMDRIDQGDGRLVRIDVDTKKVMEVELAGDAGTDVRRLGRDVFLREQAADGQRHPARRHHERRF